MKRALASKDVQDKFNSAGIDTLWSPSSDFAALVKSEVPKMRKLIEQAGAKVE